MIKKIKFIWNYLFGKKAVKHVIDLPALPPFVIRYKNDTDEVRDCILFGFNDNFGTDNFGTDKSVSVENLQGGTYSSLIAESAFPTFIIGSYHLYSNSLPNLKQRVVKHHNRATGIQTSIPIDLDNYMPKIYTRSESEIIYEVKVVNRTVVKGHTFISFNIAPKSYIDFILQPIKN